MALSEKSDHANNILPAVVSSGKLMTFGKGNRPGIFKFFQLWNRRFYLRWLWIEVWFELNFYSDLARLYFAIERSRHRNGWWEFSALSFFQRPSFWRAPFSTIFIVAGVNRGNSVAITSGRSNCYISLRKIFNAALRFRDWTNYFSNLTSWSTGDCGRHIPLTVTWFRKYWALPVLCNNCGAHVYPCAVTIF